MENYSEAVKPSSVPSGTVENSCPVKLEDICEICVGNGKLQKEGLDTLLHAGCEVLESDVAYASSKFRCGSHITADTLGSSPQAVMPLEADRAV